MTSGRTKEAVAVLRGKRSLRATADEQLVSGFEKRGIGALAVYRFGRTKVSALWMTM